MATPPDFTTGQVLTAAQMNAVGLWLVKSQTIGTGVSSVTVTNAFSADYDNYKIMLSGGSLSVDQVIGLQLGSTSSNYQGSLIYLNYGGASPAIATTTTGANFTFAGLGYSTGLYMNVELDSPFLSANTLLRSVWSSRVEAGSYGGVLINTTSYSSFTVIPAAGTMTGGTIKIYGYRK